MLELLKQTGVSKVLNDNTHVIGTWQGAATWVGTDWLPRMRAAGLRHFAWVQSSSEPSRKSANQSLFDAEADGVLLFNEVPSAAVWLRAVDRVKQDR
jgi:hypothetical protein